jgi:hypothetical protein
VFQTKIFGTDQPPSQWKLRYEKETQTGGISIKAIQVRNNAARACINSIDAIIESALHDNHAMATNLIEGLSKYQEAMTILTSHRKLSDDEIETFQTLIDDFFELWLDVFGTQGISPIRVWSCTLFSQRVQMFIFILAAGVGGIEWPNTNIYSPKFSTRRTQ